MSVTTAEAILKQRKEREQVIRDLEEENRRVAMGRAGMSTTMVERYIIEELAGLRADVKRLTELHTKPSLVLVTGPEAERAFRDSVAAQQTTISGLESYGFLKDVNTNPKPTRRK